MKTHPVKTLLRLCLSTALASLLASPATALTFKSDGSVVQKSGAVVSKSFADRFKEQFSNPDASQWAIADGREESPEGYFGNDVLLPGTPLLRITKIQKGDDYLKALAEKNGFEDKAALQRFIIANAAPQFLNDLELSEDQAISYVAAGLAQAKSLGSDYQSMIAELESVALEVASVIEDTVGKQVEKSVEAEVEKSVSDAIEEAVSYSLDSWISDAIAYMESLGYSNIYVTEDPEYGTVVVGEN